MARPPRHGEFSWRLFFRGIARALGIRTTRGPSEQDVIDDVDRWSRADADADGDDPLFRRLGRMEQDALDIYAAQGLPTQPGHYARAPGDAEWQFVARTLLPQDRWTLVQDYPPEEGWRFATLQTLGRAEPAGSPAIAASAVLVDCRALRDAPEARHEATMALLERAIGLGVGWGGLGRDPEAMTVDLADPRPLPRRGDPLAWRSPDEA